MTQPPNPGRRRAMQIVGSMAAASTLPAWSQPSRSPQNTVTVAQIVDMSTSQLDVSKDFLVGSRAAWHDINFRGGLQGKAVKHLVLEVNGSIANLRSAIETLKAEPQCVALFGSAGDRTASQLVDLLSRELPDLPHVAPWLQNVDALSTSASTFPIFASRREQIVHAIKSLTQMGITQAGAVYGSATEYAAYKGDLEQIAKDLKLPLVSYSPSGDLRDVARLLNADSPRILLFIGGTPELVRFAQGVEKQAVQRYIITMSDVNLQSVQQMGLSRYTPIIATQVVPMVNSSQAVVKTYRTALGRLFDEPPTAISLAGFVAARYTCEVLRKVDAPLTRSSAMQAFARRSPVDLGGLRIAPDDRGAGTAYVTQSMMTTDGRLVG